MPNTSKHDNPLTAPLAFKHLIEGDAKTLMKNNEDDNQSSAITFDLHDECVIESNPNRQR